jgi:hypothetical protein
MTFGPCPARERPWKLSGQIHKKQRIIVFQDGLLRYDAPDAERVDDPLAQQGTALASASLQ